MVEIPPKNNPIPNIPQKVATPINRSPLNLGKLSSKKSQTDYLSQRKKLPPLTFALKYISIISLVVLFMGYLWLKFDLDHANYYLAVAGVQENTQKKYQRLLMKNTQLKNELATVSGKIKEKKDRIAKKYFFEHHAEITEIKSKQEIQWFDEVNSQGKQVLGVFDSFNRMTRFFSSPSYADIEGNAGVIGGRQLLSRNSINVTNVTINSSSASFSVESSNIFGKVFFLSSEFIDMMNAFDFFKNGKIFSFSRQNLQGQEAMSFTLKLDIQKPGEEDPNDARFQEYIDWKKGELQRLSPSPRRTSTGTRKTRTKRN